MTTLTCTSCQHRATPLAFAPLLPPSAHARGAGIAAGATLPDPPLVPEPCFLCPACKKPAQVMDDAGRVVEPRPIVPRPRSVVADASRIVQREAGVGTGRMQHGSKIIEGERHD